MHAVCVLTAWRRAGPHVWWYWFSDINRVYAFSPDGLERVRSWGTWGTADGDFMTFYPTALTIAGNHLHVLDGNSARAEVFE